MSTTDVLIIIPTYNECDNRAPLVETLLETAGQRVVIVDDASPDGTGIVANELASRFPDRVNVLHRTAPDRGGWASPTSMVFAMPSTMARRWCVKWMPTCHTIPSASRV